VPPWSPDDKPEATLATTTSQRSVDVFTLNDKGEIARHAAYRR
jgi:hypothetical protein